MNNLWIVNKRICSDHKLPLAKLFLNSWNMKTSFLSLLKYPKQLCGGYLWIVTKKIHDFVSSELCKLLHRAYLLKYEEKWNKGAIWIRSWPVTLILIPITFFLKSNDQNEKIVNRWASCLFSKVKRIISTQVCVCPAYKSMGCIVFLFFFYWLACLIFMNLIKYSYMIIFPVR